MLVWVSMKNFFPLPVSPSYLPAVLAKKKFQNDNATFPQTTWQGFFLQ